jgi:hypothetical protein
MIVYPQKRFGQKIHLKEMKKEELALDFFWVKID